MKQTLASVLILVLLLQIGTLRPNVLEFPSMVRGELASRMPIERAYRDLNSKPVAAMLSKAPTEEYESHWFL